MGKYRNIGKKIKGKDGQFLYSAEFNSNGGSDGFIYKNSTAFHEPWRYKDKNEIVYIPEYGFPERKFERVPEDDLTSYYTRQNLIALTDSEILGEVLFDELTWQSPENLWREWCADSDKNGHWIEATWVYEKVYVPDFFADIDRKGQAPVCYNEFFDNEWKDDEYRRYCLDRLIESGCMSKEDARTIQNTLTEGGNGITEQIDYSAAVAENATHEFNDFYAAEMKKSKEEIFNDYYEIHFYNELKEYLTADGIEHPLDDTAFKCLNQDGNKVLACLYDYYLKDEYSSMANWEEITDFIHRYNEKYYENILNGGTELE